MARLAVDAWIAPLSLLPISCRIGRPCRLRYRCRIPGATFPTGCSQWQAEAEKRSSRLPTRWSTDWPGGRSPQGMEQSLHALRGRRWIATDRRMISTPPSSSGRFKPIRHPAPRPGSASCLTGRRGRAGFGNTSYSRIDLERRIDEAHAPYHRAIEQALDRLSIKHGQTLLLDCHSMPNRRGQAELVIGDRHGRSAAQWLSSEAARIARAQGWVVAVNDPYAGGFIVERHGEPDKGRHALQLEICRATYLDRRRIGTRSRFRPGGAADRNDCTRAGRRNASRSRDRGRIKKGHPVSGMA